MGMLPVRASIGGRPVVALLIVPPDTRSDTQRRADLQARLNQRLDELRYGEARYTERMETNEIRICM